MVAESSQPAGERTETGADGRWTRFRRRLPRPETLLLLLSFGWTLLAKLKVVRGQSPERVPAAFAEAAISDVVFFSAVAALLAALYLVRWPGTVARLTLVAAAVILGWSTVNAAWLMSTGVQLQPGVLAVLARQPSEFWPVVENHIRQKPLYTVPILATMFGCAAWFIWRLVRPVPAPPGRRPHFRRVALCAIIFVLAAGAQWADHARGRTAYSGAVIGFSSHWYALVQVTGDVTHAQDVTSGGRVVPRVGDRAIEWTPSERPNVVVIFLESVSHEATSFAASARGTTPTLERLASEGTRFVSTHTPVAQTNKAFWTVLTGSMPDLNPDYAESVLADDPYESLASLLGTAGYRSAFFEMSRGSFECQPGFFSNLAFDWAWFRENLEDESAYLGYMNGDDFRMIEPMFDWVDAAEGEDAPFLLGMITSVAHDPYVLPDWYEPVTTPRNRYEQYLETVRFTDRFVGAVVEQLDDRGLLDDTLLCVIGDHGDGFRPENKLGRWAPFEEVIRVPWIIRWPGAVEAGRQVEDPCSQLDVLPTILTLLGADVAEAGFEGVDALGPIDADRRLHFSTWYRNSPIGYRQDDRKLVYWPYTRTLFEYDLAADPGEKTPRELGGSERDAVVAEIRRWQESSYLTIPPKRFREAIKYDRWRVFSSGRSAWAYYVLEEPDS